MAKRDETAWETVETWRLDRTLSILQEAARALRDLVPMPWNRHLLDIQCAEMHQEMDVRVGALIAAITDHEWPEGITSLYPRDRAPCPLCGYATQSGQGFALPNGLAGHLRSHGDRHCSVLFVITQVTAMEINEAHGKRFYLPKTTS